MKKLFLAALVAVSAASFVACGPSAPGANLKTDVDTLSYALGVSESKPLKQFLSMQVGIDTAYTDAFLKGVLEGVNTGDDQSKLAYIVGLQVGQNLSKQAIKQYNHRVFMSDTTQTISLQNFMAGFIGAAQGKSKMTMSEADSIGNALSKKLYEQTIEKQFGANRTAGEEFLAKNAENDSVVVLPSGVQYKILKKGKGAVPTATQTVSLHYEGQLIDGTVFDSSYKRNKPMESRANAFVQGFNEAIQMMPVGSTWMVYIPQNLAYGATPRGGNIQPFSALVFKIELLSIKK